MTGIAACGVLLAGCSGAAARPRPPRPRAAPGAESSPTRRPPPTRTGRDGTSRATKPVTAGTITVEVGSATGATEFHYDKVTLQEPAGSTITLKFVNHTDSEDEVGHNWVLVKPGQEAEVIASSKAAGDDMDWLNVDDPAIVAHTRLIEGGQSNTITFTAAPGTYTYLCTFPGHYAAGEKGTLVIT